MDFTPPPNLLQPQPVSAIPPPSGKLPIKRKNPLFPSSHIVLTTPKLESDYADDDCHDDAGGGDTKPPPFKFHRIWTEPDEIRFLQGLLDCSAEGFCFPRDLGVFYARFSNGMSQPYTKSQLSEKLRRLRKKFRVISSRLEKGLDKTLLSPQDRALYDLSKQLWDPDCSGSSSFGVTNSHSKMSNDSKSNLGGVDVILPSSSMAVLALPSVVQRPKNCGNRRNNNNYIDTDGIEGSIDGDGDAKLDVELEDPVEMVRQELVVKHAGGCCGVGGGGGGGGGGGLSTGVLHLATKSLADVFDQSLNDIRMMIERHGNAREKERSFEKRWRDQHVAEFEVFTKRLKLVVEQSLRGR